MRVRMESSFSLEGAPIRNAMVILQAITCLGSRFVTKPSSSSKLVNKGIIGAVTMVTLNHKKSPRVCYSAS